MVPNKSPEPMSLQSDVQTSSRLHAAQLEETMNFFRFSHSPALSSFKGTVTFRLTLEDETEVVRSIRVHPEAGVTIFNGMPEDNNVNCECSCSSETFFGIYMNKIDARAAVLSGKVVVKGFAFRTLSSFASAFDMSTDKWDAFYAHQSNSKPLVASSNVTQEKALPEDILRNVIESLPQALSTATGVFTSLVGQKITSFCDEICETYPLASEIKNLAVQSSETAQEFVNTTYNTLKPHGEAALNVAISASEKVGPAMEPLIEIVPEDIRKNVADISTSISSSISDAVRENIDIGAVPELGGIESLMQLTLFAYNSAYQVAQTISSSSTDASVKYEQEFNGFLQHYHHNGSFLEDAVCEDEMRSTFTQQRLAATRAPSQWSSPRVHISPFERKDQHIDRLIKSLTHAAASTADSFPRVDDEMIACFEAKWASLQHDKKPLEPLDVHILQHRHEEMHGQDISDYLYSNYHSQLHHKMSNVASSDVSQTVETSEITSSQLLDSTQVQVKEDVTHSPEDDSIFSQFKHFAQKFDLSLRKNTTEMANSEKNLDGFISGYGFNSNLMHQVSIKSLSHANSSATPLQHLESESILPQKLLNTSVLFQDQSNSHKVSLVELFQRRNVSITSSLRTALNVKEESSLHPKFLAFNVFELETSTEPLELLLQHPKVQNSSKQLKNFLFGLSQTHAYSKYHQLGQTYLHKTKDFLSRHTQIKPYSSQQVQVNQTTKTDA